MKSKLILILSVVTLTISGCGKISNETATPNSGTNTEDAITDINDADLASMQTGCVSQSNINKFIWTQQTTELIWSARTGPMATEFKNKLWVLGGTNYVYGGGFPSSKILNDVWYTSDGTKWIEATSSANWAMSVRATLSFKNKLWVFGDHETWNSPDGVTWTKLPGGIACY